MIKKIFTLKFLFYLLLVNIITIFFIYSQRDSLQYSSIYSKKYSNIEYDSKSKDKRLSSYKEFKETKKSDLKDIEISFDATVYSVSQYDNIFQTAPENKGVRMEISKPSALGLVVGYDMKFMKFKLRGFPIANQLKLNKKYNIKIKLDKFNHVNIYLDNELITDTSNKYINYEISDIAIGTGFSKTRPFNGRIEDFSIKYSYYKISPQLVKIYYVFLFITLFLILLSIVKILKLEKIKLSKPNLKKLLKFEYYPFLTACFPILFLVSNNINKVIFSDFIPALVISIIITFVSYLVLNLFFDYKKTALIISLILIYIYSAGHVYSLIKTAVDPEVFIYIFTIAFISLIFFLTTNKVKTNNLILNFLKTISIILVILSMINILIKIPNSGLFKKKIANIQKTDKLLVTDVQSYPDIYYIILDAYANNWTLKEFFNYDNYQFLDYLKKQGFYVAEKSTSNYRLTALSIPSSINMDYYSSSEDEVYLRNLFEDNKVFKLLKTKRYKFVNINPDGAITSFNQNADINAECNQWNEFTTVFLRTTILFNADFLLNNIPRQQILCGFDFASKSISIKGPKFVYTHILSPHFPYLFTEIGGFVSKDGQKDILEDINDNKIIINKNSYLNQLIFINKKTRELVDKILAESKTPPIIIIQSDHGPDFQMSDSITYGKKMPSDDFIRARMRILNVFYFPNGGNKIIPEDITPVNSFRYLFNYYFKTNFEILDNYNYYSPDYRIFDFTDVTKIVKF